MYNILIVDDEQLMRKYLANNISTICPYFQVTGIACDGIEAIELLKKQNYDLVITDIRMPEIDGLSLSKYIYENCANTKVIIISGYNEFEYARTAIKYQVSDYLLKPLNDRNLLDVLMVIKEQLDSKTNYYNSVSSVSYTQLSDKEILSKLFLYILDGDSNLTYELFGECEKRNISLMNSYGSILLLTIDELDLMLIKNNTYDVTTYHLKLNQICQNYCSTNELCLLYDGLGSTLILVQDTYEQKIYDKINKIYHDIAQITASNGSLKVIATCGVVINDMLDLPSSNISAYDTLALALTANCFPLNSNYTIKQKSFIKELTSLSDSIYTDCLTQSIDKLYIDIKLYCSFFKNEMTFTSLFRYGCYLIKYISNRSNIKPHYKKAAFDVLISKYNQSTASDILKEEYIYSIMINSIKALIAFDKEPIFSETTQIVETAKEYILSHYNEPISLSIVADYVGVNNCYLSDLIHKKLGEPYSKYITRIRMEQAANILHNNPNIKIYNLAEKTGFVSTKHFISVFKKFYGRTPTNFLEK